MPSPFLEELRSSITRDDALEAGAERTVAFLRTADRALYNEAIAHAARGVELRRKLRQGTITGDQHTAQRAQLRAAFLDFLDEIERVSTHLRFPFVQEPVVPRWPEAS